MWGGVRLFFWEITLTPGNMFEGKMLAFARQLREKEAQTELNKKFNGVGKCYYISVCLKVIKKFTKFIYVFHSKACERRNFDFCVSLDAI